VDREKPQLRQLQGGIWGHIFNLQIILLFR